MKKKILAVAIAAIMLVTAIASFSLAYMTDTDEQTNTMTVGKVEIDQLEYERVLADSNGDGLMEWVSTGKTDNYGYTPDLLQEFKQDKPLYPVVCLETLGEANEGSVSYDNRVTGHQQSWAQVDGAPGSCLLFDDSCKNVVDKFVFVKNTGKSDVYVRTIFAFELGSVALENFEEIIATNGDTDHWSWETLDSAVEIKGVKYVVGYATYLGAGSLNGTVESGILKEGTVSYPSLLQVYMRHSATNEDVEAIDGNDNGKYDILVLSQATQTNGFVVTTDGLTNANIALITAFGEVTADNAAEWLAHLAAGKPQN